MPSVNSIFEQVKNNKNYSQDKSVKWFREHVRNLGKEVGLEKSPMKMLTDNQDMLTTQILPGSLYLYFYSPKYKDELPYYDTFPLVLPFAMDKTHFTGLNLHYLFPKTRMILLGKLMQFASNKEMPEKTRIITSWKMLNAASQFPEIQPCVKKYLKSHVKSRFIKIPSDDWITSIWLPVERFKKADNNKVWNDSKIAIARYKNPNHI